MGYTLNESGPHVLSRVRAEYVAFLDVLVHVHEHIYEFESNCLTRAQSALHI